MSRPFEEVMKAAQNGRIIVGFLETGFLEIIT